VEKNLISRNVAESFKRFDVYGLSGPRCVS